MLPVRDDTGGGGPTGYGYAVLWQQHDLLIVGGTKTVPAMTIGAQESKFGVPFQFTISRQEWAGTGTQAAAGLRASWVTAMGEADHVIGLTYVEQPDASGELRDYMEIVVGTDDGMQETAFTWPLETLNSPAAFQAVDEAYAHLQAVIAGQA